MTYNPGPAGYDTQFSSSDIKALQMIWGTADGSVTPVSEDKPNKPVKPDRDDQKFPADVDGLSHDVMDTEKADDLFGTRRDDDMFAFAGDDFINGDSGSDVISGGSGDDILDPGSGFNLVKGGKGRDLFVLDLAGYQVIEDFRVKDDELWVMRGGKTVWYWGWETSGWRTYLYDSRTGEDFAEIKGQIDLGWIQITRS